MAGKAGNKLLLMLAWLATACSASGSQPENQVVERIGTLSRRVSESSGVARSRAYPNVLWTHNDSGNEARLFAVDTTGAIVREFDVRGARNVDWEDIALGPCPEQVVETCIYIADTGDNSERRNDVDLYIFPEPDPRGDESSVRARRVQLEYENGSHDVEGVAVSPDGDVWLVSKGRSGRVFLYVIRRPSLLDDRVDVALLQVLPIVPSRRIGRWITAAAVSPDGKKLAIRTYTEIYLFELATGGVNPNNATSCWIGAAEPQGEAIDWFDNGDLVLTSEAAGNLPGTIYRARCSPPN